MLSSCWHNYIWYQNGLQGPVSISEKTSYRKVSWSLEAARFVFRIVRSLWNLTGTSAALLPMCLSNFKAMRQFKVPISWLRDFTRSYDKTSFRILRRGPGLNSSRVGAAKGPENLDNKYRHNTLWIHMLNNRLHWRLLRKMLLTLDTFVSAFCVGKVFSVAKNIAKSVF